MTLTDASAFALAVITVGFAIAAADWTVFPCADLRALGATAGLIGLSALRAHGVFAEQSGGASCKSAATTRLASGARDCNIGAYQRRHQQKRSAEEHGSNDYFGSANHLEYRARANVE